jgi:hypothetical protein
MPSPQAWPQAPQFSESDCRFEHAPPQVVSLSKQAAPELQYKLLPELPSGQVLQPTPVSVSPRKNTPNPKALKDENDFAITRRIR